MFLICADVIARGAFDTPIRGVPEIAGYSLVGAIFLQLSHSLHVGRFARAEMFIEPFTTNRPIGANCFHAVFNIIGVFVFALIVYGTWFKFKEALPDLKFGVEDEFTILVWPLRLIILCGSAMVALKYFIELVENIFRIINLTTERLKAHDNSPTGLAYFLIIIIIGLAIYGLTIGDFTRIQIGAISFVGVLVVIFTGIHIGVGLIFLGFVGTWIMMDNPNIAINTVKLASNEFLRNYFFAVVPLFVMMGLLVNESDIGKDTFDAARWALKKVKGGLGVATVIANAIFAAITGSSIASAAVFTKVAVPQMLNHGYTAKFAVGTVAGSSVLGMLIPPSLLLIIYGFVAEQSVGLLFLAAVIPGIILSGAMGISIVGMAHFWPSYVGQADQDEYTDENFQSSLVKVTPIFILVFAVMGGIYGGLFTPVEAGAVGAAGALILALLKKRLTWQKLWKVLLDTGHTTVSVLFLILAANIYGRMLALSGFPQSVGEFISSANMGFMGFMALYIIILIILGMFLDSVSIMLIILPIVLPVVSSFGGDFIWFGIITVIAVEMGLLTPPLGIAVYVVRSTIDDARVTLNQIFIGAFPYVLIMLAVTILLVAFPELSLFLLK
ncbi:MAG: TRAP transporter large permease subunit [Pseudomonadota bacterium]|nr:TRAP transporter large permease subunit [Pseudomonadota bacterium]